MMNRWLPLVQTLVRKTLKDDCVGMSAEIAYKLLFSIFPAIIFVVSLISLAESPKTINAIADLVGTILPSDIYGPIDKFVQTLVSQRRHKAATLSLLVTLWTAAGVFTSIMKSLERIYEVRLPKKYIERQIIAIALVFVVSTLLVMVFNFLLFGLQITAMLEKNYQLRREMRIVLDVLRLPIAFVIMTGCAVLINKFSLGVKQRVRFLLPGATLAAALWVAGSLGFGYYTKNFAASSYNQTYGPLGTAIALLSWMYLNSFIFLVGAELNALLYEERLRKLAAKRSA
jgi:membrane protein